MSENKPGGLTIRNSTAEFLIFTQQAGESGISVRYEEGTIWLTQKLLAELFGVSVPTVNEHLTNIFQFDELDSEAVIRKFRTTAADGKNYLTRDELEALGRIVNAYLDLAEDRAQRRIPMNMEDWSSQLDRFLELTERGILQNAGRISTEAARQHAESEFEKYRVVQDRQFESDFDQIMKAGKALEQAEQQLEDKERGEKK